MRILITTAQTPFVRGGAEAHADNLRRALRTAGHEAEIVSIPFNPSPLESIPDQMLACRLLNVREAAGRPVDRVIGMKFPAYLIPHPEKVIWLIHQYRASYDLWDHPMNIYMLLEPSGRHIRDAIHSADRRYIGEAKSVYANSATVARRLQIYCGVTSTPLYHPPPHAEWFYTSPAQDYFFFPSRLVQFKRQMLAVEALAHTWEPVHIQFAGAPDEREYFIELQSRALKLDVADRITWLGDVSEEQKLRCYAEARGVIFPPVEEDYGYITLETMLASKPVITCTDSSGPLEFVIHGETGLVVEPTAVALGEAMDTMWRESDRSRRWGRAARARFEDLQISWDTVANTLTS